MEDSGAVVRMDAGFLTRGLECGSFLVMTCFLITGWKTLPKKEPRRSLQVVANRKQTKAPANPDHSRTPEENAQAAFRFLSGRREGESLFGEGILAFLRSNYPVH